MRAWYAWYPGDFIRDTRDLTLEERGAYRELLDHYYMRMEPIPLDRFKVAKLLAISPQKTAKILQVLLKFFEAEDTETGTVLYHKRVEVEINKSLKLHRELGIAGRAGGLAKARNKSLAKALARPQPQPHIPQKEPHRKTRVNDNDSQKHDAADEITTDLGERFADKNRSPHVDIETGKPLNGKRRYQTPQSRDYTDQDVVDLYHQHCTSLLPIRKITFELSNAINQVHNEPSEIRLCKPHQWANFFKHVERSDFLTGRNKGKPSRFSLRDIIKPEMHAKIAEGKYD